MKESKLVCAIHSEFEPGPSTSRTTSEERPSTGISDVLAEQKNSIPSAEELEVVPIMGPRKTTNVGVTLPNGE